LDLKVLKIQRTCLQTRPYQTKGSIKKPPKKKKTKLKPGPKATFEIKNWMTLISIPELEIIRL
jgi:hypothetical protein